MSNCDDYTCPFISDKCDEPDTLAIIQQFRKVYEDKLKEIDKEGCSDSLQLKLKIQEKWIDNLTEQTEMMARVVKELEVEAAERVQMLEDKLKRSSECACEVMRRYQMYDFQFNSDDYFQRLGYLENDLKSLLEFIRRIREDNRWSIEGLIFYEVDYRDLFGKDEQDCKCSSEMVPIDGEIGRGEEEVSRDNQDEVIERLRKEVDYLRSIGNSEELLDDLKKQREHYDELKQNMIDMRQALTEEVACKHDLILLLKKDIQQLEERCVQNDKQTAFKDDIIKELRKEIKQLKQQKIAVETCEKQETLCNCDEVLKKFEEAHQHEISQLQTVITELRNQLQVNNNNVLEKSDSDISCDCANSKQSDISCNCPNSKLVRSADSNNEEKKKKEKLLEEEIEKRQVEIDRLKDKCKQLEKNLANTKEQTENLQHAEKTVQFLNEDLRVLQQEKDVHEQIISYFKNEMSNMSGELANLHDILETSNETCRKENQRLIDTLTNLENSNQRLQSQLKDNQEKLLLENETNIEKISELELIIKQKDVDLELHDQEINRLSAHLDTLVQENQELNQKIIQLHEFYQHNENNESERDAIIKDLSGKIQMLERTNQRRIDELIKENQQLRQILEDAKRQLEEIRDNKELSRSELITIKETLQKKQGEGKLANLNLCKKCEDTKNKLCSIVNDKNRMENELIEMKRKYEGILQELKESLSKINISIIDGKFVKNHNYFNNMSCSCNLIEMCKLEIRLTETLIENFKDEFTKLSSNLNEMHQQNSDLISQLQDKDNEILKNHQELQQLKRPELQCDECFDEFIEFLKYQIKNVRSIEDCNCATTKQEEILLLKDLIKDIIQEESSFNKERDKLQSQINCLQTALKKHEDANRLLHSQYETNYLEFKHLLDNNKLLQQEKDDMSNELEALQNHCSCLEKRNRQLNEITKNLEFELVQTKAKRDDICAESKLVIDCVRSWLNEQKKINNEIQQRKLAACKVQQYNDSPIPNKSTNCPATPYDWNQSLGLHFPDPCGCFSPDSCSYDDDDDDNDDDDDDDDTTDLDDAFVRRTEEITRQIRCSNRCFKYRFPNSCESKNDD